MSKKQKQKRIPNLRGTLLCRVCGGRVMYKKLGPVPKHVNFRFPRLSVNDLCDDCYFKRYCRVCDTCDNDSPAPTVVLRPNEHYGAHPACLSPLEQLALSAE